MARRGPQDHRAGSCSRDPDGSPGQSHQRARRHARRVHRQWPQRPRCAGLHRRRSPKPCRWAASSTAQREPATITSDGCTATRPRSSEALPRANRGSSVRRRADRWPRPTGSLRRAPASERRSSLPSRFPSSHCSPSGPGRGRSAAGCGGATVSACCTGRRHRGVRRGSCWDDSQGRLKVSVQSAGSHPRSVPSR